MGIDVILDGLVFIMVFTMGILALQVDHLKQENRKLKREVKRLHEKASWIYR